MTVLVSDIVRDVRVILDENRTSNSLEGINDVETLSLDALIESKVEDGARMVLLRAPLSLLSGGDMSSLDSNGIVWSSGSAGIGSGYIPLPDDFLRLLSFKMSDWTHAVVECISEFDPRYALQHSRYDGIKGNPQCPVVALVSHSDGACLEFFSCIDGEGVTMERGAYLCVPKIITDSSNGEKKIVLPERLLRSVLYYVAYIVSLVISPSLSSAFLSLSEESGQLSK